MLVIALAVAACGEPGPNADVDFIGGGSTGRAVNVTGSSTVEPVSALVAERLASLEPSLVVNVDGPGTGDGFELFCSGGVEIADASRPIAPSEVEACETNDVEFIELKVAIDGLSVITNPAFDAVECLSFVDLYALVGPESQGFGTWSDAQLLADRIGTDTDLPDTPLNITGPGEESGTYDSFVEIVIEELADERGAEPQTRPDYSSQGDDNAIVAAISGSPGSLGWVGLAFAEESADEVRQLAVDGGDGCVAPSPETVGDGSYPISRPLFIYVSADAAETNPDLATYVDFYLSDEGIAAAGEVGYVQLPPGELEATRNAWSERTTGTRLSTEPIPSV